MKIISAVIASTLFIGGAYAQSSPPAAVTAPSAVMKSDAKRDMRMERHISELHAKLKITAAEESQWATVAKTMRDSAGELDNAIDKREAVIGKGTAIDDLNAYGDIAQAHADSVKKLAAVFAPLYASMPQDQKALADSVFAHHAHSGKKAS